MTNLNTIFLFVEIGTSCDGTETMDPPTSSRPLHGAPPDAGGELASVYEEQKNLETLLDKTIDVSGESSGEEEIPEEVLLNTSSDSCPDPTTPLVPDIMLQPKSATVTTQSESCTSASATSTTSLATNSDTSANPCATHSAVSTAIALPATVATNSESGNTPVAKNSEAVSHDAPAERMEAEAARRIPVPGEYYAIQSARKLMRTVPDLNGGYPAASKQPGTFYPPDDSRMNICNVVFDIKAKQVCSTSFDPGSMTCHCCGQFLERKGDKGGRQTFVLTDQNFPAALPSDNTGLKCLKIIRIEGGRLGELADKFIAMTAGWEVLDGSLILLGSLSHLAETGLAAYAADLCAAVNKLTSHFRRTVSVAPAPFTLAEDTEDAQLIRSVHEFYAWTNACLKNVEGWSSSAHSTSMEGMIYNGAGLVQPDTVAKYRLPTNFTDNCYQIWTSSGLSGLPSKVKGFDINIEVEIIGRLLADLNQSLGMDLQPNPYYDRKVEKEDIVPPDNTVFIVVGGSHALRTANGLARQGKRAIAATIAGWRPTPEMNAAILNKITRARGMCPDTSKAVCVLQLWDNCNYFVRDEEGGLTAPKKEGDGRYHIKGAATFAHQDTQLIMFKKTLPVLDAVKDMRRIVLSPLPRYMQARCCQKKSHVTNFDEEDYKQKLETSVYEAKNNIRGYCFREGYRNLRVLGSWHLVKKEANIWGKDPVHMEEAGYNSLARHVITVADDMTTKRKPDTPAAGPSKRARTEVADSGHPSTSGSTHSYQDQSRNQRGRHWGGSRNSSYSRNRSDGGTRWDGTNSGRDGPSDRSTNYHHRAGPRSGSGSGSRRHN